MGISAPGSLFDSSTLTFPVSGQDFSFFARQFCVKYCFSLPNWITALIDVLFPWLFLCVLFWRLLFLFLLLIFMNYVNCLLLSVLPWGPLGGRKEGHKSLNEWTFIFYTVGLTILDMKGSGFCWMFLKSFWTRNSKYRDYEKIRVGQGEKRAVMPLVNIVFLLKARKYWQEEST